MNMVVAYGANFVGYLIVIFLMFILSDHGRLVIMMLYLAIPVNMAIYVVTLVIYLFGRRHLLNRKLPFYYLPNVLCALAWIIPIASMQEVNSLGFMLLILVVPHLVLILITYLYSKSNYKGEAKH